MDICFLTCICLWQISLIQTFLFKVVGPGLVSTSPAFVNSSASHPAGPHGRHAKKTVNRAPIAWGRGGSTQFAQQLESAVTAPPLVGCVVWSHFLTVFVIFIFLNFTSHSGYNRYVITSTVCTRISIGLQQLSVGLVLSQLLRSNLPSPRPFPDYGTVCMHHLDHL